MDHSLHKKQIPPASKKKKRNNNNNKTRVQQTKQKFINVMYHNLIVLADNWSVG